MSQPVIRRKKKEVMTDPNKLTDNEKVRKILDKKETPNGKAEKVAKVVTFHFSVGDGDRARSIEKLAEDILSMVKARPYSEEGLHATQMGAYYILDGVVCLPADYDPKAQQMLQGHFPPPWAGGPTTHPKPAKLDISGGKYDRPTLSAAEYDAKYKGLGNPNVIKDKPVTEDDLEEIDWDEKDIGNDEIAESVAKDALKNAKRVLKIKKHTEQKQPAKRVVRRAK